MGYRHIKYLESVEHNRKLFYLDRGAIDLPPITDFTSIAPGSEARSLTTGEKWVLNTKYKWVWIGTGDCCCSGGSGSGNGGGQGDGDGDVPVPGEEPSINGVTIVPQNITVGLGAVISFSAKIDGDSKLNQGITWTLKGQNSVNTRIANDGTLTIAENEKSKTITVRATSQGDTSKYAQATVTVDPEIEDPTVEVITNVVIAPREIEVIRGRSVLFSATVHGVNLVNRDVIWEVSGMSSNTTKIDQTGKLTIGSDEMNRLLVVRATAAGNTSVTDSITVTTVLESDADNPMAVTGVRVIPDTVRVGQGYSTKFAAVVDGQMNPPQDVQWKVVGTIDPTTRVTSNGVLFVGENEKVGLLTVIATSVYAPDIFGESDVQVLDKDNPNVQEEIKQKTVTAVLVVPDAVDVPENTLKIFSAIVIGNNDPSQAVTWKLEGANVQTTYVTDQGVVIVGRGETAKILKVIAISVQDPSKSGIAYINVQEPSFEPATGIEDVPKAPLGAKYVRQRLANGESAWALLPEEAEEGPTEPDPEIRDIQVDPESITVAPGSVISFTARMDVTGDISDEVKWSIKGNDADGTHVRQDGRVFIAENETSKLITVRATSILDSIKYGRATIAVDKNAPLVTLVTNVKVIPSDAEIIRGRKMRFQAIVSGVNITNPDVRWSITGQNSGETTIDEDGVLSVADAESCSVIIVTATSLADSTKSATCVLSVIPPEQATNVWEIKGIKIVPENPTVGQGRNTRVTAIISGINNPPQDIIWEMMVKTDAETHVTRDGLVFCGIREIVGHDLLVRATSVYDPTYTATVGIRVFSHDDPAIDETTVLAVIAMPDLVESSKGAMITFSAVVLGNNNPPQDVDWVIFGNKSAKTTIDRLGVLRIAPDEIAKAMTIRATCKGKFSDKYGVAFVILTESQTDPKTGIPDVPEAPLNKDYIRRRDQSGKAIWVEHIAPQGSGRGGYLGTYDNKAEMDEFLIFPDGAAEGDFCIISHDETHGSFPSIWTAVGEPSNLHMEFDVVLGRPFRLGDKLNILNVLDNEVHASNKFREIDVLDDFDTNEVRWELHECPSAWKLVTELHPGFWNMIKHNPDRFKALIGMDRHTGAVKMYLTCFTDDHEFAIPVYSEDIENPRPINNTLSWSNTIMNGYNFVAANEHEFIQYAFDPNNFTLSILQQNLLPNDVVPGVSPWATVVGEYTMLANGEVIGPLANVTDPTGYMWVANREHFMIGSAGDGTQMFCYSIDTEDWFIFDVPAGSKVNYQFATDLNERYFMMFIDGTHAVWGDRITHEIKQVVWKPTGYAGLSVPTSLTRPSISVDGKYYLHTSTNNSTPVFSTFDFDTGNFVTEAPMRGTSSSAIGLSNGRRVFTNTPEGQIIIWNIASDGTLSVRHQETPYAARYVVHPTGYGNNLMLAKVENKVDCPVWYIYDCDQEKVIDQSAFTAPWCVQTNP